MRFSIAECDKTTSGNLDIFRYMLKFLKANKAHMKIAGIFREK
jgi:hypothetical protein